MGRILYTRYRLRPENPVDVSELQVGDYVTIHHRITGTVSYIGQVISTHRGWEVEVSLFTPRIVHTVLKTGPNTSRAQTHYDIGTKVSRRMRFLEDGLNTGALPMWVVRDFTGKAIAVTEAVSV